MAWPGKKKSNQRQARIEDDSIGYTFRRSRTLAGSASPNVKTTKRHTDMQSSRQQSYALKRRRRRLGATLLAIILILAGLYWLMTQYVAQPSLVNFTPPPQNTPQKIRYQQVITRYLQAHPIERFRFALNDVRLNRYVKKALPEVAQVKNTGGGIGYGAYQITLRQPVVTWHFATHDYLVDANGVTFSKNYYQKPAISVLDKGNISVKNNQEAVASNRFLTFLGRMVSRVSEVELGQVGSLAIPRDTSREIDVKLKGDDYFFKTSVDREVAAQVQDMQRVKRYLRQHNLKPQYVDLRVEGRAFYR